MILDRQMVTKFDLHNPYFAENGKYLDRDFGNPQYSSNLESSHVHRDVFMQHYFCNAVNTQLEDVNMQETLPCYSRGTSNFSYTSAGFNFIPGRTLDVTSVYEAEANKLIDKINLFLKRVFRSSI
jgi:hypothetical protein